MIDQTLAREAALDMVRDFLDAMHEILPDDAVVGFIAVTEDGERGMLVADADYDQLIAYIQKVKTQAAMAEAEGKTLQ